MLSIIIPSKKELFFNQTIKDVLKNAKGNVEIFPILDGYEPDEIIDDKRVKYIRLPETTYAKKRHGINQAVEQSQGEFIMSLDAHCLVAPGFDVQLEKDHQWNWVQVPRRHRLDAENWCLQDQSDNRPPIDYEYTMWPLKFDPVGLHGFKWDEKTLARMHIPIDETMHFQGSCWFMTKEWFNKMELMQVEGYTGWGQEAEEIALKTHRAGGKVMTNKNTYYAHLHKGAKYGRMYWLSRDDIRACTRFAYDYWVIQNKDFYRDFIKRFWPVPGWPEDWEKQIWG